MISIGVHVLVDQATNYKSVIVLFFSVQACTKRKIQSN